MGSVHTGQNLAHSLIADRLQQAAAQTTPRPQQATAQPASATDTTSSPADSLALPAVAAVGAGLATGGGRFSQGTRDTMERAAQSTGLWSTRTVAAAKISERFKPTNQSTRLASNIQATSYDQLLGFDKLAKNASLAQRASVLKPSNIFKNIADRGVTPGSYLRETVFGNNVKDIANFKNNVGAGLARSAGIGVMGFNIFKTTRDGYHQAKEKYDDGSLMGKLKTFAATASAFATKTGKSLITWEVAGIGFSIGSKFLTFGGSFLGGIPIGGIVAGAVAAAVAGHQLDKLIKDPPKSGNTSGGSHNGNGGSRPDQTRTTELRGFESNPWAQSTAGATTATV